MTDLLSPDPWDPQPGEPGTSFAGFVLYRETPPQRRNLRGVARRLGRTLSLIERYSGRWHWVDRVRAWDARQADQRAEEARRAEADWGQRHADAGKRMQAIGLAGLSQFIERGPDGTAASIRQLRPRDLLYLITAGADLEVTAATHRSVTLDVEFVEEVIRTIMRVFVEANSYATPEARTAAFEAGCHRALAELAQ